MGSPKEQGLKTKSFVSDKLCVSLPDLVLLLTVVSKLDCPLLIKSQPQKGLATIKGLIKSFKAMWEKFY
jgi:hypothetical protein